MINPVRIFGLASLLIGVSFYGLPASAQEGPPSREYYEAYRDSLENPFWEGKWISLHGDEVDWEYDTRRELDAHVDRYLDELASRNLILRDPLLQDYLQRLLVEIHPNPLIPDRPGALRIFVVRNATPNAFAFNNGTILLTVGLLGQLNSSQELLAVLAHEVAHIILDHPLQNYKSAQKRQAFADVLGTVLGTVAGTLTTIQYVNAGVEAEAAADAGISSMLLSLALSEEIIDALAAKFSREQEEVADEMAQRWLTFRDHNIAALASALQKLEGVGAHDYQSVSFRNTHPAYDRRIAALGDVMEQRYGMSGSLVDPSLVSPETAYIRQVSPALEDLALIHVYRGHYHDALPFLDQVINAGWASSNSYLLKAISLRHTAPPTPGMSAQILSLLDEGQRLSAEPNPRIYLEQGLIHLREDRSTQARKAFEACQDHLDPGVEGERQLHQWTSELLERIR